MTRAGRLASWCLLAAGCVSSPPAPVAIAAGDSCANCRMAVVSPTTAAQIVAPGEEPVMFDEVGCLRDYLARTPLAADAVAYVADHRTSAWVDARAAVFTQTETATPMTSGLLAHVDAASRDADATARGGRPVLPEMILGRASARTP